MPDEWRTGDERSEEAKRRSEAKKRKIHGPEYKAKIGLEAVRGVKTINEIAQEYGVHPVQVGQYKKQILAQASQLFLGKRGPKSAPTPRLADLEQPLRECDQTICGGTARDGCSAIR